MWRACPSEAVEWDQKQSQGHQMGDLSEQTGKSSTLRLVLALVTGQKSPLELEGSYWLQPGALRWWDWEAAVFPPRHSPARPSSPHKDYGLHISLISRCCLFPECCYHRCWATEELVDLQVIWQILWCADNSCYFEGRLHWRQSKSMHPRSQWQS